MFNKHHSDETRNKISKSLQKLNDNQQEEVLKLSDNGLTQKEIALKFGVSRGCIKRILNKRK